MTVRKPSKLRLAGWLKRHKLDVVAVCALLVLGGVVSAYNMAGYPQRFEDEGTYISQAWAIKEQGKLTHYTYWYDHPPVGWIQIAAYLFVGQGLERYGSAITAGREFMLVLHLATIGLLYALARRLRIGKVAAFVGVLLYALSPLSIEFSRYVLLDNIAVPWLLGAFLMALSPKRSLFAAVGAAVCMAIVVLIKITFIAFLPVILYCLWVNGDKRNRRYTFITFSIVFIMLCAFYVLYAILKNELLPGKGHVSLLGTLFWQLFGREGSGSIFDNGSNAFNLVKYWLNIDYFLLAAGAIGLLPALLIRALRPAGLALLIGFAMLLRTGYLPFPYIIAVLPFAALSAAGTLEWLIGTVRARIWITFRACAVVALVEIAAVLVLIVAPAWQPKLTALRTIDADTSSRQAVEWVSGNVPRGSRMVVESALWVDLETKGFTQPEPVWLYKTETDPAVRADIGGWRGIDYVVLNAPNIDAAGFKKSFPTVSQAIKESRLVAQFGSDKQRVLIYQVDKK